MWEKQEQEEKIGEGGSIYMYVNTNSNNQDSEYAKVYDCMNQDSYPTGTHVAKLYHSGSCR